MGKELARRALFMCLTLVVSMLLPLLSVHKCYASGTPVYVFTIPGCDSCISAIERLQESDTLTIYEVDVSTKEGFETLQSFYEKCDVPRDEQGHIPCAFAGGRYFTEIDDAALDAIALDAIALQTGHEVDTQPAESEKTPLPSAMAIAAAGLADGINPCSLGLLFTLVAYLYVAAEAKPKQPAMALGIVFILGTLLAYWLLGLGVLKVLGHAGRLIKIGVFGVVLLLLLALKLSRQEGAYVSWLRRVMLSGVTLPTSFALGALSSGLEFFCTGQLYLPTLIYLSSIPAHWSTRALLLLYLIAFSVPLWATLLAGIRLRANLAKALDKRPVEILQQVLIWGGILYFAVQIVRFL